MAQVFPAFSDVGFDRPLLSSDGQGSLAEGEVARREWLYARLLVLAPQQRTGDYMAGKRPTHQQSFSRADVRDALRNLARKGLVVARKDVDGKVVYFCPEYAPPPGPFRLGSYRRKIDQEDRRSHLPLVPPRRGR